MTEGEKNEWVNGILAATEDRNPERETETLRTFLMAALKLVPSEDREDFEGHPDVEPVLEAHAGPSRFR
jgi:hypothetical protein